MSFLAGILTFLVVVNCLVLVLLVLMQLPKKDAGAGMAFGGAAADALFGAGSGNFLTQATKYSTIVFFLLALFLGHVETRLHSAGSGSEFEKKLQRQQQQQAPISSQPVGSATTPEAIPPASTVVPPISTPPTVPPVTPAKSSNAPAAQSK